jgi:hypothetical protein
MTGRDGEEGDDGVRMGRKGWGGRGEVGRDIGISQEKSKCYNWLLGFEHLASPGLA